MGRNALGHFPAHLVPTGPWLTLMVTPLKSLLARHSEPQHSSPPQEGAVAPWLWESGQHCADQRWHPGASRAF